MGAIAPGKSNVEQQESVVQREDELDVGSMLAYPDKHAPTKIAA